MLFGTATPDPGDHVALTAAAFTVIHRVMRFFRQIIGVGKCGHPLAALVGVLLALQALIGGFGSGAMAQAMAEPVEICASPSDHHDHHSGPPGDQQGEHQHQGSRHSPDCCLTACRMAASLHASMPIRLPEAVVYRAAVAAEPVLLAEQTALPRYLPRAGDARGPPVLPV